jgi:putative aldouronate transport system permease protein
MIMKWIKTNLSSKVFHIFNVLFFLILVSTMIIPLLNTWAVSFSSNMASMQPGIKLWPDEWSIEGYKTIWKNLELWRPFLNSVIVTVVGTIIHVTLAALGGYVLIQPDLPGKKWMTSLIMITMMIPGESIMIPLYIVNKELGLLNTLASLVLSGLVSGFSILLMRNYYLSIPYDLSESAQMDGASHFQILTKIYLPLTKSGLATVTLFEFVSRWNQFTSALLYIQDPDKFTLQLALRSLIISSDTTSSGDFFTNNVRMAGIMIALIPLLIIYPFVQKYFVKGITMGSTKE